MNSVGCLWALEHTGWWRLNAALFSGSQNQFSRGLQHGQGEGGKFWVSLLPSRLSQPSLPPMPLTTLFFEDEHSSVKSKPALLAPPLWQILTTMVVMKWPQNTYNYSETSCVFVRSALSKLQSMFSGSLEALTDMSIYNIRNNFMWFFFLSLYCSVIGRSRLACALFKCNFSWGKKLNQRMM